MHKPVNYIVLSFIFDVQNRHHTAKSKIGGDRLNIWHLERKILTYFYSDPAQASTLINEK